MARLSEDIAALLAPMTKKTLWAVLTTAQVPGAAMAPHAPERMRYFSNLEEQGVLWGSGPFVVPGCAIGNGLTIFNVPNEADVHHFMVDEPLTKRGMQTYTVYKWELCEGRIAIDSFLSQSWVMAG